MNMDILRRSRRQPQEGDIFVYKMKGRPYGFGRVIRLNTRLGWFGAVTLIYVYDVFSEDKNTVPALSPRRLLIPPLGTNRRPWTMGYFETVETRPLTRKDVLSVHCFKDLTCGCYRDEYGKVLSRRSNPCGDFALDSFRTIDAQISLALGIEPASETVPPPPPSLSEVVAAVARELGADASRWVRAYRGDTVARAMAAWLARHRFDYSAEAICKPLGYSRADSVRQAIRRIERDIERFGPTLRKIGRELAKPG